MVYNHGIYEEGKYKSKIGAKHTKEYLVWHSMISRCYNCNYHGNKNYSDVEVYDDWLYFQNFAEWFHKNYYEITNETMVLEKDYKTFAYNLDKNYTPNNCMFLPQVFNKLIIFQHNTTKNLPVGVKERITSDNKLTYVINLNKNYGDKYYIFTNTNDAYEVYLSQTYNHIKQNIDRYKTILPNDVLQALYDFCKNDGLRKMHNTLRIH